MWDRRFAQLNITALLPHLDRGDPAKGKPAAKVPELRDFMFIRRKKQGKDADLAAKYRPGGDHNLMGAECNRADWEAVSVVKGKGRKRRRKWLADTTSAQSSEPSN